MSLPPVQQTLLQRIRRRVLVPLALAWALGSALVVAVSYASTAQAFDRALLDQGLGIAASIRVEGDQVVVSPSLVEPSSTRYVGLPSFAVYRAGVLIAGDADLAPQALSQNAARAFDDTALRLRPMRKLTLRLTVQGPVTIVVAQDLRERAEWLKRLVAYSIVPQVVLLLVLGWWLGRAVADEVAPLSRLQRALEQRRTGDLRALEAEAQPRAFELTMLTQAINGLLERIERGVRAQRQFAGDVAHELRTPLAGMRSAAEHALSSAEAEVWRTQLRQTVVACDRAGRTIEQLLHLAVAAEADAALQVGPVRLDTLVREVVLDMMPRADKAGVDLGAEGIEEDVTVIAHGPLLEGVLRNLVENALRHGRPPRRDVGPVVTVAVRHEEAGVVLSVTDNGPGMPRADAARLLGRWERGPGAAGLREGSGLGLAIVARYCELMALAWRMDRAAAGGVVVRVWLPSFAR